VCGRSEVQFPGRPNLTQGYKGLSPLQHVRLAVLPWRLFYGDWTPQTRYTFRPNTASIMKGLVWLVFLC